MGAHGRKKEQARARETREGTYVSPSRARIFSCGHFFLAPATQAMYVSCRHASGIVRTATAQNWNKSFTHIELHAEAVGREAGEQNPSPQS